MDEPKFLPSMWSLYERITDDIEIPTTQNLVEGFHRGIYGVIGCAHPTMFTFINHLRTMQAKTNYTLDRLGKGVVPDKPRTTPRQRLRRAHIISLVINYDRSVDNKLQYLESLSTYTGFLKKK